MSSSKRSRSPTARGSSPGGVRSKQAGRPSPIPDKSNTCRELFPEDACNDAVFNVEALQRRITGLMGAVREFDYSARQEANALRDRMNDILNTITLHEEANVKKQQAHEGKILFLEAKLSEAQERIEELEAKLGEQSQHAPHAPLWARLPECFYRAGPSVASLGDNEQEEEQEIEVEVEVEVVEDEP